MVTSSTTSPSTSCASSQPGARVALQPGQHLHELTAWPDLCDAVRIEFPGITEEDIERAGAGYGIAPDAAPVPVDAGFVAGIAMVLGDAQRRWEAGPVDDRYLRHVLALARAEFERASVFRPGTSRWPRLQAFEVPMRRLDDVRYELRGRRDSAAKALRGEVGALQKALDQARGALSRAPVVPGRSPARRAFFADLGALRKRVPQLFTSGADGPAMVAVYDVLDGLMNALADFDDHAARGVALRIRTASPVATIELGTNQTRTSRT